MRSALNLFNFSAIALLMIVVFACSPQKETAASRGMQNLTARYNILYNARELIKESEQNIDLAYQENYDVMISSFKEPNEQISTPEAKKLDEVILKANAIINDKSESRYVDDAYLVIAKANFLKSNFFNATEFFNYIYLSYPKQPELRQTALAYKSRGLMNSDRFTEAKETLDTAFKYLDPKASSAAELYAIKAQLAIHDRNVKEAADLLLKAINLADKNQNRIRWTYLLAQLQKINGSREAAYQNFTRVIKSNAPFEMAFNAKLNLMSLAGPENSNQPDRNTQLLSLLKNDNNVEFADQVYYEIAESHLEKEEFDKAIENFNVSIRKSIKNNNQKGLSYLALADIFFKQADYVRSKAYYDSTLNTLPPNSRDYDQIKKKASSLELLANRLSVISREDTLQMLAALPEADREQRIGILVRNQAKGAINPKVNEYKNTGAPRNTQSLLNTGSEKFYFNNPIALSQGLSDFQRMWGNRKLEDNWRRSQRSSSDFSGSNFNDPDFIIPQNPDELPATGDLSTLSFSAIPVTPEQMAESNQRILSAFFDIGNYYRETLNDEAEAIKTYETILTRFPDNHLKLPVYYNLYRLYATTNPKKSLEYKTILINQYPGSPFAKVIKNPEYNRQSDEQETALHQFYERVYESYTAKNYPQVLAFIREANASSAPNKFSPQLAYLNALALGHTQKLDVLDGAFKRIIAEFPDEKLIVPLVTQHLRFIDSNRVSMGNRKYALIDSDPNEPLFVQEPFDEPATALIVKKEMVNATKPQEKVVQSLPTNDGPVPLLPETAADGKNLFSLATSEEYYFVISVSDPAVNLSSSRFGIGQFNRVNFADQGIKHQLKSVNNQNQLIFVGAFGNRDTAAEYTRNINPLMKEIMKVPADRYTTFYISKPNLEKLADRESILKYIEFYQQNLAGTNN